MASNPYDPLKRTDLSTREKILLRFTAEVVHGTNVGLIDTLVAPDYMQHPMASRRVGRESASTSPRYRCAVRGVSSGARC